MSLKSKAAALGIAAAVVFGSALPALATTAFATSNVNVRECGSTRCAVVDVLRRGDEVDVRFCEDLWCAIGRDEWVNANYLSRDGGYDDDYYDDYDDDFYIVPRRRSRVYPIYPVYPRYRGPDFSACVGGPNARFCVYD
jgi:uncharacterized protein YraI